MAVLDFKHRIIQISVATDDVADSVYGIDEKGNLYYLDHSKSQWVMKIPNEKERIVK